VKNLEFDPAAFEDLAWWIQQDRKKALRIVKLIKEVQRHPFEGTGKPEALKHDLAGCWFVASTKKTDWCMKSWKIESGFLPAGIIIDPPLTTIQLKQKRMV